MRGVCGVYITNKHKEAERLLSDVKKNDKKSEGVDYYLALLYHKSYLCDKALGLANAQLKNHQIMYNNGQNKSAFKEKNSILCMPSICINNSLTTSRHAINKWFQ